MKNFVLYLMLANVALAQPANTDKAREAFGAAQKLYQASRFAEALKKFEEAQALKPHPVIVFNIARCHELMGSLPQALKAYREYVRLSPDAQDKAAVQASIAALEKKLPALVVQTLIVNAEPEGSTVSVDGKAVGTAPMSVDLSAGEHSLEVSAVGFETLKRQVTLAASRTVELNVSLRAVVAPVVRADVPKKEPVLTPVPSVKPEVVVTQPDQPPARKRPFAWVFAGTAVASAAVATGMGVGAMQSEIELHGGDPARAGSENAALADQAQGLATGANVAWGLAGAAAITAVVLFIVEGK